MADHVQDQILEALKALLVAAGTAAGTDVYIERVDPIGPNKCPGVEIIAGEESIAPPTNIGWPRVQHRAFEITIRCTVARNTDYRKQAGNLAKEVEAAIAASPQAQTLNGLAREGVHLQRSTTEKDGDGEKALYSIVQTWIAGYRTVANAPDNSV